MFVEIVGIDVPNVVTLQKLPIQFGYALDAIVNLMENVVLAEEESKEMLEQEKFAIHAIRLTRALSVEKKLVK